MHLFGFVHCFITRHSYDKWQSWSSTVGIENIGDFSNQESGGEANFMISRNTLVA